MPLHNIHSLELLLSHGNTVSSKWQQGNFKTCYALHVKVLKSLTRHSPSPVQPFDVSADGKTQLAFQG